MGFKKCAINRKEALMLEFGYGDMHNGLVADNVLMIHQGRPMTIGAMNEDNIALSNHVDLPKAIEDGNVILWSFTKSESVDSIIKQLQIIKQNLIENGK